MAWLRSGGPDGIQALQDLGMQPAPEDLAPPLEWETPLWRLFQQLSGQWRVGFGGPVGLDLNVFLPRIEAQRWDVDRALELLHAIERAWLQKDNESRDADDA